MPVVDDGIACFMFHRTLCGMDDRPTDQAPPDGRIIAHAKQARVGKRSAILHENGGHKMCFVVECVW